METDVEEVLAKLRGYVAQGYVLHGSQAYMTVVEPRQARDSDKSRVTGNQYAVYAEAEDIRVPIVKALLAQRERYRPGGWSSFYTAIGSGPMRVGGKNACLKPGWVHVLPSETFRWVEGATDREFISKVPVVPVDVVRVEPSIVTLIPTITFEFEGGSAE